MRHPTVLVLILASALGGCSIEPDFSDMKFDFSGDGGLFSCPGTVPHGSSSSCILSCVVSCDHGYMACPGDDGCGTSYLDDPNNCGACGVHANGACHDGWRIQPERLGPAGFLAEGLVMSSDEVYWMGDGVLRAMDKSSKTVRILADGQLPAHSQLTLADGFVYWMTDVSSGAQIRRVSVNGGAVEVIASLTAPASNVAVFGGTAYFIDSRGNEAAIFDSTGAKLAPMSQGDLAFYGSVLYVDGSRNDSSGLWSMRPDGSEMHFEGSSRGTLQVEGSAIHVIGGDGHRLTVDSYAFGAGLVGHREASVSYDSGGPAYVSGHMAYVVAQVTYSQGCILGGVSSGEIVAVDFDANSSKILLANIDARTLAVDDGYVYFTTHGTLFEDGSLYRIER